MRKILILMCLVMLLPAQPVEAKKPSKQRVERMLSEFLTALNIRDFNASARAIKPFVHRSLLNNRGTDLSPTVKPYSFKKAHRGAKFYKNPVEVARIAKTHLTAVGYGGTAEKGRVYVFYIKKKRGIKGPPAPIHVFYPDDGSAPKVFNMGGL